MEVKSVIFIRRDNIGDLVCTTPAIRAFRLKYPRARLCVLVNSYNADAVRDNPDIDEVFVYEKEKHAGDKNRFNVLLGNLNLIRRIRKEKFDAAIGCSYSYSARLARYAYLTGAKQRIGYARNGAHGFYYNMPMAGPQGAVHEVEAMMGLLAPLGVKGPPPPLFIMPLGEESKKVLQYVKRMGVKEKLIAFHISSRKPQNRWPRERFKELGDKIQEEFGLRVMLLWSPGNSGNALHPGDDESADWLITSMKKRPLAYRTERLTELIAAMGLCELVFCMDGGAMHVAAALGKPVLTVWGTTDRRRWAPWGVPNIILQDGNNAGLVGAGEAFLSFKKLYSEIKKTHE